MTRNKIRKERFKGVIVGLLIGLMLIPTSIGAATTSLTKSIYYKDVKITLDGATIKPVTADGTYVEPFIMDGTTYLPIRGIASCLGLSVDWDNNTNTVVLSTNNDSASDMDYSQSQITSSYSPSADEVKLLVDYIGTGNECNSNGVECLRYYIRTSNSAYMSKASEFFSLGRRAFTDASKMEFVKKTPELTMYIQEILNTYEIVLSGNCSLTNVSEYLLYINDNALQMLDYCGSIVQQHLN